MPEQAPSPFAERTLPESTVYLYIDGIDLTPFADRHDLDNTALEFAQGQVEQFKVRLRHWTSQPLPTGGRLEAGLPAIREGMVSVMYIQRNSDGPPANDYHTLFSGKVIKREFSDDDIRGSTILHVTTPIKMLKHATSMVFENKGSLAERNDVIRLRAVGQKWGNVDFDFSLPTWGTEDTADLTYNVTYPEPNYSADSTFFINGERFTTFTEQSVDDIIRDIMTDPGQDSDAGYPVVNRQWWWEGRFIDEHIPTKGIKWHLVMAKGIGITREYKLDLMDAPDPRFPGALVYDKGAGLSIDYNPVVRRVVVSGDEFPQSPMVQIGPGTLEMVASGASVGHAPDYRIGVPAAGWVRKVAGSSDVWDSAVGGNDADPTFHQPMFNGITQLTNDFALYLRVQETTLFHDGMHGPNVASLDRSQMYSAVDAAFPPGKWITAHLSTVEAVHNTMGRLNNQARPHFIRGVAIALANARASTCIVRATPRQLGDGMALIVRAAVDANFVLTQATVLYCEGSEWRLRQFDAGSWTELAGGHTHSAYDGTRLVNPKINCKHSEIQVFFNDVPDPDFTVTPYNFGVNNTLHGIGALDAAASGGVIWGDLNITEFWGDKAIGVGDQDSGEAWYWIDYGFVMSVNGTLSLIKHGHITPDNLETLGVDHYGQGGDDHTYAELEAYATDPDHPGEMPADVPYQWADIKLAHDELYGVGEHHPYSYNDVFKIVSVLYLDDSVRSVLRKVQWWKQPGGAGEWVLLREELGLPIDIIAPHSFPDAQTDQFWYVQAALKDLGATFTAIAVTPDYADTFQPTGDLANCLVPLVGDFPATGVIRHSRFNSYVKRQKVGNAVLREYGDPHVELTCTVHPPVQGDVVVAPFERGDIVRVTNRRAGWVLPEGCDERVDDGCGPHEDDCDTRRYLVVRSIQRMEAGARGRRTAYRLVVGSKQYDITDPARTHLLAGGVQDGVLYNPAIPETAIVSFVGDSNGGILTFHERDQADNTYLGVATQVRMKAPDATAWLPTLEWPAGVRKMQIPAGYAPTNAKMEVQHRTVGIGGTLSKWSQAYTMITQAQAAYDRPYNLGFIIGNGVDTITTMTEPECDEWQLNEACAITGWSVVHNGTGEDNQIVVDVELCREKDRTEHGVSSYASICGSGTPPYCVFNERSHGKTGLQGQDLRGWSDAATHLQKGDWLRVRVTFVSDGTNATKGTVMLTLARAEVNASSGTF